MKKFLLALATAAFVFVAGCDQQPHHSQYHKAVKTITHHSVVVHEYKHPVVTANSDDDSYLWWYVIYGQNNSCPCYSYKTSTRLDANQISTNASSFARVSGINLSKTERDQEEQTEDLVPAEDMPEFAANTVESVVETETVTITEDAAGNEVAGDGPNDNSVGPSESSESGASSDAGGGSDSGGDGGDGGGGGDGG